MSNQNTAITTMQPIRALLEKHKENLAQIMPKHLTPDRLLKVALNCIAKTPKLQQCTASSLLQCVITAAELGLEPGGALGHLYLVPFEDRKANQVICTVIIGYRGYIELARRSGQLAQIEAHIVHEKDDFKIEFGLTPVMRHVPMLTGEPGAAVLGYMLARLKDGSVHCEVMTIAEINKVRQRSRSKDNGPWTTDYEEMAKKTVLRRGMKYMPLSAELARAFEAEDDDVLEGEPAPLALAADNAQLAQQVIAPSAANEKAKAAVAAKAKPRKMELVDEPSVTTDGEPPPDVVLPVPETPAPF